MGSKRRVYNVIDCIIAVQGHLRSLVLIQYQSTCVYDFLLVISSNFDPILYCFRDTAQVASFCTPHSHLMSCLGVNSFEFRDESNLVKVEFLNCLSVKYATVYAVTV